MKMKKRITEIDIENLGVQQVLDMLLEEVEQAEAQGFYIDDADELLDQLGELVEALEKTDDE